MRTAAIIAAFILAAGPAAAGEAEDLVDRAIQAHGGADKLAKLKSFVELSKGTVFTPGAELPARREAYARLPERLRWFVEMTPPDRRIEAVLVVGPEKGWRRTNGQTEEMTGSELSDIREEVHAFWLATLLPLKGDGLTLTALPPTTLDRKPARGLRVAAKGKPDVVLFFDTGSGLLVKAAMRCREAGLTVTKEFTYGDHKPFDGLTLPTKLASFTNTRKVAEFAVTEYRFPTPAENDKFDRP